VRAPTARQCLHSLGSPEPSKETITNWGGRR
jgi:hypothetical protein